MIRFNGVSIIFLHGNGDRTTALKNVDLTFHPGRTYSILGANGSGKSNLVRSINGLIVPKTGTVEVFGRKTNEPANIREIREDVQLVFQDPDDQLVTTIVEDELAFGLENLQLDRAEMQRRIDDVIDLFDLQEYRFSEPHNLSGGQKQRLAIACAVAMRPKFLMLDEPTSMLDGNGQAEVTEALGMLREISEIGIIHITHSFADALESDEVILLDKGTVTFEGDPRDVIKDPELIALFEKAGIEIKDHLKLIGHLMKADPRLTRASVEHMASYLKATEHEDIGSGTL